jgi:hypothetical protein
MASGLLRPPFLEVGLVRGGRAGAPGGPAGGFVAAAPRAPAAAGGGWDGAGFAGADGGSGRPAGLRAAAFAGAAGAGFFAPAAGRLAGRGRGDGFPLDFLREELVIRYGRRRELSSFHRRVCALGAVVAIQS